MCCHRCGGRLFLEPEGDALACFQCGERLWSRLERIVDLLLEAVLTLEAREQGATNRNLHAIKGRGRPNQVGKKRGPYRRKVAAA